MVAAPTKAHVLQVRVANAELRHDKDAARLAQGELERLDDRNGGVYLAKEEEAVKRRANALKTAKESAGTGAQGTLAAMFRRRE